MPSKRVHAASDDIRRNATCKPQAAIEEFIWNGLDSGAKRIEVRLEKTGEEPLVGLKAIEIVDGGDGIPFESLDSDFGSTGDSRKPSQKTTADGRLLHGRYGRGRFKFLMLGGRAVWRTVYRRDGKHWSYEIRVTADQPDIYEDSDPKPMESVATGTMVRIEDVTEDAHVLLTEAARQHLRQHFAFYLKNYPTVEVIFDGEPLSIGEAALKTKSYPLELGDGVPTATLTIIEWDKKTKVDSEHLLLCDANGFTLGDLTANVPLRDINGTAYVSSEQVAGWHQTGELGSGEMHDGIAKVAKAARRKLSQYIRKRIAQRTKSLVLEWQNENVYPYKSGPNGPAETAERQVFNILAAQVHQYHRPFQTGTKESRRLTLGLLRQALESSPTALQRILTEVLNLPEPRQRELANLLEYTNLDAIIEASKTIHQRLDTICGFERILFDQNWRAKLRERTQLHRLLVHELWIFGEQYELDTDDERLRELLTAHIKHLNREELAPEVDFDSIHGIDEIPDLMLTRRFKRDRDVFEHLVVELKNPRVKAGEDEVTQIERVARNVLQAEPFSKNPERVKWTFMLVVNDLGDYGNYRISTSNFARGCIAKQPGLEVWLVEWGDVLHDAKVRYEFFREKLNLEASGERGLKYLDQHYNHLLADKGMSKRREIEAGHLQPGKRD